MGRGGLWDQELFTLQDIARIYAVSESFVKTLIELGYLTKGHKLLGARRWFRIDVEHCLRRMDREPPEIPADRKKRTKKVD